VRSAASERVVCRGDRLEVGGWTSRVKPTRQFESHDTPYYISNAGTERGAISGAAKGIAERPHGGTVNRLAEKYL